MEKKKSFSMASPLKNVTYKGAVQKSINDGENYFSLRNYYKFFDSNKGPLLSK